MAYKPQRVQIEPDQKKVDPKSEPKSEKHDCEVCGEPAVIRHSDGHFLCYNHEQLRLTESSFERVVALHKKGVDTLPKNVICR